MEKKRGAAATFALDASSDLPDILHALMF